ncbi:MAG TPA: LuxR C-terminal-related transcriptional regulator [Verrucomicrobiae bacterium]|nr:LuxR C-terminal-related transcriptional regulator [Verrucomicrobiae bacterium]
MTGIEEIVKKRQVPPVFVISPEEGIVWASDAGRAFLSRLDGGDTGELPAELAALCERLSEADKQGADHAWWSGAFPSAPDETVLLRAFYVKGLGGNRNRHVLVTAEGVVDKHAADIAGARQAYGLSAREMEVVELLCTGASNREIARTLFISEYTVKDHVKKIMQRLQVSSRSEIIAVLK